MEFEVVDNVEHPVVYVGRDPLFDVCSCVFRVPGLGFRVLGLGFRVLGNQIVDANWRPVWSNIGV